MRYLCARYPNLKIKDIEFHDGYYETEDRSKMQRIERNDWFDVYIRRDPTWAPADGGEPEEQDDGGEATGDARISIGSELPQGQGRQARKKQSGASRQGHGAEHEEHDEVE